MGYLLNRLPLTACICLSFQNIGSHSLRFSKQDLSKCKICPQADFFFFFYLLLCFVFLVRNSEKVKKRIEFSVHSTETLFTCINLDWQLLLIAKSLPRLFYHSTLIYSTRGATHSDCCFGTDSYTTCRPRKWIFLSVTKLSSVCAVQTKSFELYFTANSPSWENSYHYLF